MTVFWDIAPCSFVVFRAAYCHHHGDDGSNLRRLHGAVSHRRTSSSYFRRENVKSHITEGV
jgi:hypothetical protein